MFGIVDEFRVEIVEAGIFIIDEVGLALALSVGDDVSFGEGFIADVSEACGLSERLIVRIGNFCF